MSLTPYISKECTQLHYEVGVHNNCSVSETNTEPTHIDISQSRNIVLGSKVRWLTLLASFELVKAYSTVIQSSKAVQ